MKHFFNWKNSINENELNTTINAIKENELILMPTETVYGIAANAYSDEACKKIFEAKGRESDNPLIIHVSDKEMLYKIVEKPNEIEEKLINAFMPGPFTLILKKKDVISNVACKLPTVGIRMPSNKIANEIIRKSNIPLAAPSANISGKPSGTKIEDIINELEDKIDVIIDGGECDIGIESTVVKVIDGIPTILRPGFITEEDIKEVSGFVNLSDKLFSKVEKNEKVESPGMKYRHYAPKTKCVLVLKNENQIEKINQILEKNKNACVLGFEEDRALINIKSNRFLNLGSKNNLEQISHNIFSLLRKIDEIEECELAIIEGVEKEGLGLSIMNRLIRACEYNIV